MHGARARGRSVTRAHGRADTLLGNLTVQEMLAYTAELKSPAAEPLAGQAGTRGRGCAQARSGLLPPCAHRHRPEARHFRHARPCSASTCHVWFRLPCMALLVCCA